jgi:hypothetical protein
MGAIGKGHVVVTRATSHIITCEASRVRLGNEQREKDSPGVGGAVDDVDAALAKTRRPCRVAYLYPVIHTGVRSGEVEQHLAPMNRRYQGCGDG